MFTVHCWDTQRGHHGPCCMYCIIEETNRRAGCPVPSSVAEYAVFDKVIEAVTLTVRACCFHGNWMAEALAEKGPR